MKNSALTSTTDTTTYRRLLTLFLAARMTAVAFNFDYSGVCCTAIGNFPPGAACRLYQRAMCYYGKVKYEYFEGRAADRRNLSIVRGASPMHLAECIQVRRILSTSLFNRSNASRKESSTTPSGCEVTYLTCVTKQALTAEINRITEVLAVASGVILSFE